MEEVSFEEVVREIYDDMDIMAGKLIQCKKRISALEKICGFLILGNLMILYRIL